MHATPKPTREPTRIAHTTAGGMETALTKRRSSSSTTALKNASVIPAEADESTGILVLTIMKKCVKMRKKWSMRCQAGVEVFNLDCPK